MGLKEPGLRGSLRNTSSVLPAFFDVTITNTNSPVQEGDILTVDYSADNTGDAQDMQDIRLEIDSVQEDVDPDVMLAGGASTTGTLEWDTTDEAEAEYTATVLSDDDSDSVMVEIGSAIPDSVVSQYDPREDSLGSQTTATDQLGFADLTGSFEVISDGINGNQSYRLDGTNAIDHTTTYGDENQEFAVCFVYEIQEPLGSTNLLLDGGPVDSRDSFTYSLQDDSGGEFQLARDGGLTNSGYSPDGNPHVATVRGYPDGDMQLRVDGTDFNRVSLTALPLSGLTIGGRASDDGLNIESDYGGIETLVNPDLEDIQLVEERLSNDWDTPDPS